MILRDYLDQRHESAAAFAARIGLTRQAVHSYLSGSRTPKRSVIEKIRDASGGTVQPNDWYGEAPTHARAEDAA